ncbi:MAG: PAS-domain containing protein [Pseudomonadota bacterium]
MPLHRADVKRLFDSRQVRAGAVERSDEQGFVGGILDTLRDGVLVVGNDLRILYANPTYYEQLGITEDDIAPGDHLVESLRHLATKGLLGPMGDRSVDEFVERRMETWGTADSRFERRFLENGRILEINRSMTLANEVVAVHVDVTSAVKSEEEIERQRIYMTSLLENMSDGLALLDREGRFAMFNDQFLGLYDIDPESVHWGMDYETFVEKLGDLAGMSEEKRRAEIKLRRDFAFDPNATSARRHLSNGRTLNINKTNLPGGGCVMTTRDMTDQLRREQDLMTARSEAEESARSKSEFVARMSHEMRTPLNGILGVAALLDKSDLSGSQRELVDVICNSGNVLLRLIDDILDLSRIDAETFQVVQDRFRMSDVVRECVALIGPSAEEKGLDLIWPENVSAVPALSGDMVRIKQILLNLLANAVKFTDQGHVEIGLEHMDGPEGITVSISVSDTGVGIAPDRMEQVFDRFFQVDGTITRKYGGAGLGLAITRNLVDAMGGTIQVRSEPDKGTSFLIRLTLAAADPPATG